MRRWSPWVLGLLVLVTFTVLTMLQISNEWKRFSVDTASDTILLYALSSLNFIALIVFGFIFLRSIVKLMRERRALKLGSKLKTKLLVYFAAISLLPIFAMAGFSYLFMNRALERWFTSIPENVVRAPLEIETRANEDRYASLQNTARIAASALDGRPLTSTQLTQLTSAGNLSRIVVFDREGKVIADSSEGSTSDPATLKDIDDPLWRDGKGTDAASAPLSNGRLLVAESLPRSDTDVSGMVDSTLAEFDKLKEQNVWVRQIGLLTLGVLSFLLVFASSWTAFYIARGLTVPIRALAEGAENISRGRLDHRVQVLADDELALLVSSFNEMSATLEANSAELSERRKYIETVLLTLPTGVVSVDAMGQVGTINPAARTMLDVKADTVFGAPLLDLLESRDRVTFERLLARAKRIGHAADQVKIAAAKDESHDSGTPVAVTATALPDDRGVVLVLEDLSELIAAQRAAAWQEVARRMAHEIKNPLTPIQLSAERIAKRFRDMPAAAPAVGIAGPLGRVPDPSSDANARLVADGTDTILREVQSLKMMVDEFSQFARLPDVQLEPGDVSEIVRQAAELYRDRGDEVAIQLRLADDLPSALTDAEQLKRVFVNLIDNAIEAPSGSADDARTVVLSTRYEAARDIVVAEVADNGAGIDPSDYPRLFQPYFSTKGRGTGLGLAIVRRIVADHRGKIVAAPNAPRGAKFVIELPVNA